MAASTPPSPTTLGELRASGHVQRSVKSELRDNLLHRLREGDPSMPGLVGLDDTVLPEVERALLAGHDFVLLGERGQGKTRLMRTLAGLLDEWTPCISGSALHEHPYDPITVGSRQRVEELGDDLPVSWWHRDERYAEKLATPDTSIGDLIGDVDPTRLAEGRSLGDPETVHYGLLPRAHRGIFGLNELPDLAERIQVGLFNVLEERDIQIRGYALRLPLDLLVVASANPEDYTNRGRIITPLKDRFGAEIRTHYPTEIEHEVALVRQEAAVATGTLPDGTRLTGEVPEHLLRVVAHLVDELRGSTAIDQSAGVSARFAVAATEELSGAALRRAAVTGDPHPVARIGDLAAVLPTLRGKLEFEMGEEGREADVVEHLARLATATVFRELLVGVDLTGFTDLFAEDATIETGPLVSSAELLQQFEQVPGLSTVMAALGVHEDTVSPGQAAAAVELVCEGLYLTRRLSKATVDEHRRGQRTVYGS
ncbi:sigma 54-interacting transcriptional regulator [Auraticoccus monumenti]|uniref:Magnesium chelatase subunit I n=1 Tax=Auraticoccus monumenti TaxID=675864 RepID=A0A1G6UEA5_9ACTN|nr:sigma 54-interacting transcriptional regulator [Auraticoccus monumenti]SDD38917.1 magnesium chelatase subunit I [Auraticoccus monumenti]